MMGGDAQNYPQYKHDDKQEAARFLASDFSSYDEIINGMVSIKRVDAWQQVVERFDPEQNKEHKVVKIALQERREYLVELRDTEFSQASQLKVREFGAKPNQSAVTDGGAVAESDMPDDRDGYEDAADFESKRQKAYQKSKTWKTLEQVQDALQEEFARDARRPHVVDALEERLQEVAQE